MPIYDISGAEKASRTEILENPTATPKVGQAPLQEPRTEGKKGGWLSSLIARLFFIALLILDISWGFYALLMLILSSVGAMLSFGRLAFFTRKQSKSLLSIKRSLVCALSLVTAVFSPAFGIMIACTYFLMYDKSGIEEIVPESLQEQFKEFFQPSP
jgi:hypothetical protein